MIFQKNLVTLRKNAGYSARSFADKLNIPYTTYLAYEKSDREPKYSLLIEIANLLNTSIDDLLGRTPTDENYNLEKELNSLLSSLEKEKNISIEINSINQDYVNLTYIVNNYRIPIDIEKTSIIDNIKLINKITNTTKRKIFKKNINDIIAKVIKKNLVGVPVNTSNIGLFYLQNELSSTNFIQDYEDNKQLLSKLNILIHKPENTKKDK